MPVRIGLGRPEVEGEQDLREEIKAELLSAKPTGEPVIIIDRPHVGTTHLYVIWSKWGGLEQRVRSRIVYDAFAEAKGTDEADNVTVAMGLTPDEADRLGIK